MKSEKRQRLLALMIAGPALLAAQPSASDHVDRALRFADLNNWNGAAADFAAAETMFASAGDARNALYAHLGTIRATITQRDLLKASADLEGELAANPLLQVDSELRKFCLIVKGDIDGEIDSGAMRRDWEEVHSLAQKVGDEKWQYRSLGQIGIAAFYDGDLETARKNVAAALIAATKNNDVGAEIRFLTAIGIGLREAHMASAALEYFVKALKLAEATPDAGYQFPTNEARLETLIDMGRANESQQLAEQIMSAAREQNQPQHEVVVLTMLAHVAIARKDADSALRMFNQVLALGEKNGLVRKLADAQSALAEIYRGRGDFEQAQRFAELAIETTQQSGDEWAVPQRQRTLAEIQAQRGRYAGADETYDRAGAFVDALLGRYSGIFEKLALIKVSSQLYIDHFSLLADHLNNPSKAYQVVEQVRGRVMTDLLLAGSVISPQAAAEQRTLSALELKLKSVHSVAEIRKLRDEIFLAQQARWVTPEMNILKADPTKAVDIETILRSLSPRAAILEYVVADPRSYCLVISRAGRRIVPLPSRHHIEALTIAYLKAIKTQQSTNLEGRRLYDALIAPLQEAVRTPDLVVVRDGILHLLPFDALIDSSGSYMVERHTIVYSPSATAFYLLTTEPHRQPGDQRGLLAVGGIPYDRDTLKQVATTRGYDGNALSDLPASKDEVLAANSALSNLSNTLLLGINATESAFKRAAIENYRVVHLAVHGYASPTNPDEAALVLLSDSHAGEDGLLHPAEVVQLKLRSALAILSACDTAVGPVEGEEGIETLSRAFLLAGARNVISTLWSVDDTFSLSLMKSFYQHLAGGEPPTIALVAAKRDMLRRFDTAAVPYFWAGYTIEGAFDDALNPQMSSNVTVFKTPH